MTQRREEKTSVIIQELLRVEQRPEHILEARSSIRRTGYGFLRRRDLLRGWVSAHSRKVQMLKNLLVGAFSTDQARQDAAIISNLLVDSVTANQVQGLRQADGLFAGAGCVFPAGAIEDGQEIRVDDWVGKLSSQLPGIKVRKPLRHFGHLRDGIQQLLGCQAANVVARVS